jgi:hypothetical protein
MPVRGRPTTSFGEDLGFSPSYLEQQLQGRIRFKYMTRVSIGKLPPGYPALVGPTTWLLWS